MVIFDSIAGFDWQPLWQLCATCRVIMAGAARTKTATFGEGKFLGRAKNKFGAATASISPVATFPSLRGQDHLLLIGC